MTLSHGDTMSTFFTFANDPVFYIPVSPDAWARFTIRNALFNNEVLYLLDVFH